MRPFFKDFLLDSGAFSFFGGKSKNINWIEYTKNYAEFIKKHDINNFIELDIEKITNLNLVEDLRKLLQDKTGKNPIPNCFAVFTDIPNAFELAYAVFTARKYEIYIKGSVIPFIRLSDAKEVLSKFANKSTYRIESNLKQIELIDKQIINLKKQIENLEHLKKYNAKVICNI